MLQRVVFPKIGMLPVKQVTPAHILDVLNTALKKNGLSVATEAKRTMSAVFELAVSTLRTDSDPVYPVRKALPANKTQHKRPLSTEEVGLLLRQLDGYDRNFQTVSAFRLMWLTLCRPNEAIGAQWKEIDLEGAIWRIPPERMKKRKEHVVPLPRQAVAVLRAMQGLTGGHAHVFPHRDDRTKPMADASLRQALKQLGWSGKYSPHATRTTGSTRLNEMGFTTDWIERQLAHSEPNAVRRTYSHADYLADRTKMCSTGPTCLTLGKRVRSLCHCTRCQPRGRRECPDVDRSGRLRSDKPFISTCRKYRHISTNRDIMSIVSTCSGNLSPNALKFDIWRSIQPVPTTTCLLCHRQWRSRRASCSRRVSKHGLPSPNSSRPAD